MPDLFRRFDAAVVYVTQDCREAMALASRVAVMRDGRFVQTDAPETVYDFPASADIARVFGEPTINLLPCETVAVDGACRFFRPAAASISAGAPISRRDWLAWSARAPRTFCSFATPQPRPRARRRPWRGHRPRSTFFRRCRSKPKAANKSSLHVRKRTLFNSRAVRRRRLLLPPTKSASSRAKTGACFCKADAAMATLRFEQIRKTYRSGAPPAVRDFSLRVEDGEIVGLLGSSGCGKTTTLRAASGFVEIDSGAILIDEKPVHRLRPARRQVAMAFEGYALYPPLSVRENIAFALARDKKRGTDDEARRIAEMLEIADILEKRPMTISAGQQQRVSLARALIRRAAVTLLDEPMSQLEPQLRAALRVRIKEYLARHAMTTVFVTHDQNEAVALADRIAVMEQGVLRQCAPAAELKNRPANLFVAGFVGEPPMNLLPAVVDPARKTVRLCPPGKPPTAATALPESAFFRAARGPSHPRRAPASNFSFARGGLARARQIQPLAWRSGASVARCRRLADRCGVAAKKRYRQRRRNRRRFSRGGAEFLRSRNGRRFARRRERRIRWAAICLSALTPALRPSKRRLLTKRAIRCRLSPCPTACAKRAMARPNRT